jgi:DNA-binding MarR family transcriptional regulator
MTVTETLERARHRPEFLQRSTARMSPPLPFDPIAEAARQWTKHWGADATPSMRAVTSIMRAHQILIGRLNQALAPYDLTFPRYEALMLLYYSRTGSLPLGKMGDRLQVHRTSVTNLMDGLEREGLAERSPHPTDRRTILATIKPRGRDVARKATRVLNRAEFGTAPVAGRDLDVISDKLTTLRVGAGDFEA